MTNATYQSADDCPLGEAHGTASTHGNANNERCCDFCGFPVAQATNATPGPVEVRQADRDAAADAVQAYRDQKNNDWQGRIRRGECDDGYMVQAFARHRIEAARPVQSELVEALGIADGIIEADLMDAIEHGDADWEGRTRTALEAIRALVAKATGDGL